MEFKSEVPAGTNLRGWPLGTPCKTASDQEICANDVKALGLCGTLMAHGRVCIENDCKLHGVRT